MSQPSPAELKNLKFISIYGKNLILDLTSSISATVLYGMYILIFCAAASILLGGPKHNRRAKIPLFVALTVMFLLASYTMWTDITVLLVGIKMILWDDPGVPFATKQAAYGRKFSQPASVERVVVALQIIFGDSILFWRVYALAQKEKKVYIVPSILLFCSIVFSLGFIGCMGRSDWPISIPETCQIFQISALSFSMATNVAGTVAIGYQTWRYRKTIEAYLSHYRPKTRIGKIFVLFLESGIVYSVIWILQLSLTAIKPPKTFPAQLAKQLFMGMSLQVAGIYPTLLVVLVYLQRSIWDPAGESRVVNIEESYNSTLGALPSFLAPPKNEDQDTKGPISDTTSGSSQV